MPLLPEGTADMGKYTKEDIIRIVQEEQIRFIRLQFTDIFGALKNVAITASQLEKALSGQIMLDGSSIEGFVRIEESDQYLRPDLDSFVIFPWSEGPGRIARIICSVYNTDGTPFVGDPRNVLSRQVEAAAELGFTFNVGPECEFFLFQTEKRDRPIPNDEAGYFDLNPGDTGEVVRREICLALEEMGFEIEASHHETAPGQHEIDFKYARAMHAADNIKTFELVVKSFALRNNLYATFMPKPLFGVAGSGMHTNMSLFKDGKNAFYDPQGTYGLSKTAMSFIAGLMEHIRGLTAITNPLVNSYKRLVAGFEAPCYIAWSATNRSALIRIPTARGNSTRIELRSPDSACNPYLALACCLAAGLDGVRRNLTPPDSVQQSIYDMTAAQRETMGIGSLPATLEQAIEELQADRLLMDTLGDHVSRAYIDGKKREWTEYCTAVTDWELKRYFFKY